MPSEKIITVFGSSRPLEGEPDYEDARALGRGLAERGFAVCTGGYGGVMAGVSRGAKKAGGKTYGVTADFFSAKANAWVDVEVRVATWQDRLFELIRLADGFGRSCPRTHSPRSVISGSPSSSACAKWSLPIERRGVRRMAV